MEKELVCITCPMSCHLKAVLEGSEVVSVTGNTCPRGEAYAKKELTHPTRMLTSTVVIKNGLYDRLPVITSCDIPKEKLFDVMEALKSVCVEAPVSCGDVVLEDVCGTGANIVASRSMGKVC